MISLMKEKLLNVIESFTALCEEALVPVTVDLVLKYANLFENTLDFLIFPFLRIKLNFVFNTYFFGNLFLDLK